MDSIEGFVKLVENSPISSLALSIAILRIHPIGLAAPAATNKVLDERGKNL